MDKIAHPKLRKKIPSQITEDWAQIQSLGRLLWNLIKCKQSYFVGAKGKSLDKEGRLSLQ